VAGVYARVATERGVQHPPDGVRVTDVLGVSEDVGATDADLMVAHGANVIRDVSDRGIVLHGARTTSDDAVLRYVSVRRLLVFLEQAIVRGLQWTVFEPNGPVLWINVCRTIDDFLLNQWQTGALAGSKPEQAYFVRCDRSTMTQDDIDNGRFIALVGIATVRPAEFVILRFLGQTTRRPDDD
jgi:phage tail sheath protein FI